MAEKRTWSRKDPLVGLGGANEAWVRGAGTWALHFMHREKLNALLCCRAAHQRRVCKSETGDNWNMADSGPSQQF